jgi:hypothetical protein
VDLSKALGFVRTLAVAIYIYENSRSRDVPQIAREEKQQNSAPSDLLGPLRVSALERLEEIGEERGFLASLTTRSLDYRLSCKRISWTNRNDRTSCCCRLISGLAFPPVPPPAHLLLILLVLLEQVPVVEYLVIWYMAHKKQRWRGQVMRAVEREQERMVSFLPPFFSPLVVVGIKKAYGKKTKPKIRYPTISRVSQMRGTRCAHLFHFDDGSKFNQTQPCTRPCFL